MDGRLSTGAGKQPPNNHTEHLSDHAATCLKALGTTYFLQLNA